MSKFFYLLLFFCVMSQVSTAQTFKITGKVTDASDGSPLPGVTVKNQKNVGTMTDIDGTYTINANKGDILTFSFLGMMPQEIKVLSDAPVNVVMNESESDLDEVVVIGYGTVKKRDLTGSVSQVKASDVLKGNPSASINAALQGRMAGVVVGQSDGAPGGGINIQVRGTNSFSTNSQPLYVVDGIPFEDNGTPQSSANENNLQSSNALSSINPNDIESIEVLKDASATAIYGSRGANGVVLITTKRGEKGKTKIEFVSNLSVGQVSKKIDMLDASTYASYINEEKTNALKYYGTTYTRLPYPGVWSYPSVNGVVNHSGGVYLPGPEDFNNLGIRTDQYGNQTRVGATNWQDAIFRTSFTQEYNLNVSGGSDQGWFSFSGNYLDEEGIIQQSGFKRYALRSNIGRNVGKWLKLGLNINYTNTKTDFAKAGAFDHSLIRSALIFPPTFDPSFTPESETDELTWLATNPYVYVRSAKDELRKNTVFTSSYAEVYFLKNFKFRQNLGLSYNGSNRYSYYNKKTTEGKTPTNGKAGQSDNWYYHTTAESVLTYDKEFNKLHKLNILAGFTYEESNYGSKSMSATNFPSDITGAYDMSSGLNPGVLHSSRGRSNLVSLLSRANYSYASKYMATASFRRDGSSKFIEGNKFANFLSGALAWRISEEKFIKDLNFFDDIKLRASYGQTGNQGINAYQTQYYLGTSNYAVGGVATSGFSEVISRGAHNDNLKWETVSQFDTGIDVVFFNNRVSLSVDAYWKETSDLLQFVQIPVSTGFKGMWKNSGNVRNKGLELSGSFGAIRNPEFNWNINANISFNRNSIHGLDGDQFATRLWYGADEAFIQRNGAPIGAIYGYVEDGFYNNEVEVRADPAYANADAATVKGMVGEIRYRDLDGKPGITSADRTIIGNTNPDYVFGITNNFEWKNFNFGFFIQGSIGGDIFNGNLIAVKMENIGNIPRFAYDERWTPDNMDNAKWPKAISGYDRTWKISDRYIEDGSYVKLKNINLGYTFKKPAGLAGNIYAYASVSNVFTITKYRWYDPDVNAFGSDASKRGVDIFSYPTSRTFSFGVKLNF